MTMTRNNKRQQHNSILRRHRRRQKEIVLLCRNAKSTPYIVITTWDNPNNHYVTNVHVELFNKIPHNHWLGRLN